MQTDLQMAQRRACRSQGVAPLHRPSAQPSSRGSGLACPPQAVGERAPALGLSKADGSIAARRYTRQCQEGLSAVHQGGPAGAPKKTQAPHPAVLSAGGARLGTSQSAMEPGFRPWLPWPMDAKCGPGQSWGPLGQRPWTSTAGSARTSRWTPQLCALAGKIAGQLEAQGLAARTVCKRSLIQHFWKKGMQSDAQYSYPTSIWASMTFWMLVETFDSRL